MEEILKKGETRLKKSKRGNGNLAPHLLHPFHTLLSNPTYSRPREHLKHIRQDVQRAGLVLPQGVGLRKPHISLTLSYSP